MQIKKIHRLVFLCLFFLSIIVLLNDGLFPVMMTVDKKWSVNFIYSPSYTDRERQLVSDQIDLAEKAIREIESEIQQDEQLWKTHVVRVFFATLLLSLMIKRIWLNNEHKG